jgi:exodeoxyribonuclease V beta subunit
MPAGRRRQTRVQDEGHTLTIETIDLSRHAVIEASAGTGKTYTIEQLVLRLLIEAGTPLEKILLVTFTEKATADLKIRLRLTLEAKVSQHPEALQPALDYFDQAPIFTIHGFCQRLLQEHALEQGQDFRAIHVDDGELLKQILREVQCKLWRSHFGDKLRAVLDHAGLCRAEVAKWEDLVLQAAGRYQSRSGHQLRPTLVPDWWQRLDEPGTNWAGQLAVFTIAEVRRQLGEYKHQRGLQSFDDMIAAVEESLDAELNAEAPSLLLRLRERYRFGIVDEFQDTDPLQWRIFRRIFVEGGASRLFVVGDPKQAIFGFRSADLPTYLQAAEAMKTQAEASEITLGFNWRSDPELIEALNCVFLDGEWFSRESGISYKEVRPPEDDQRLTRIDADRTGRAALTIVDMRPWDKLAEAHKHHSQFVAQEIQRLLHGTNGQPSLVFSLKKAPARPLEASDICVLVMTWRQANPIAEALDRLGVPYSIHKGTGFWDSDEVLQLETLLVCLSRPEERSSFRKALLTCFFRIRCADLARNQDLPFSHPTRQLYQKWREHAEARQWSALFQSMLEDTGLLLHALKDAGTEMQLAGLRHLMGTLERVGHGENRDLLGLIDWIRDKRRTGDTNDAEQPPPETQRPRVRIMTVHASKGLEFPVVFLAGGFTKRSGHFGVTTYRDDQQRKVFDLSADTDADGRRRTIEEEMSEQRRLLYVALTRPMLKLYVPMVQVTTRSRSHAGSVGTVLLPALKQACPDKLGDRIAAFVVPPQMRLEKDPTPDEDAAPLQAGPVLAWPGVLFPALDKNIERRRVVVKSFSSMSRQHVAQISEGPSYGDQIRIAPDETAGAAEKEDPLRGPVFGEIVHNVLEAIDFAEVGRCTQPSELLVERTPVRLLIEKEVRANVANLRGRPREKLEQAAQEQVARLVWQALHTPLQAAGGPLHRIPQGDRIHEMEFQFPEHAGEPVPADMRREDGFVMGYMDLVFRAAGHYFLVDYKTNLLPGYTPDHLQRCMDDSDYHRQYRLYLHALDRWLRRVHGASFSLEQQFGGVYYLFVRGLNGLDESAGVFFHRPTLADIDLARIMQS